MKANPYRGAFKYFVKNAKHCLCPQSKRRGLFNIHYKNYLTFVTSRYNIYK